MSQRVTKIILFSLLLSSASAFAESVPLIDMDDLRIDITKLNGQKVRVQGVGQYMMNTFMLKKNSSDMSPMIVQITKLQRDQQRQILQQCSDIMTGCNVTINGTVGKVSYQNGIIAEEIELLGTQKAEQTQQNVQELQEVTQLKQETEASKLESEKLSALQEKQEANRLKQELLEKQVEIQVPTSVVSAQKSFSPSFDCEKVSTGSERLICSSKELSVADVKLAQAYKAAAKTSTDKGNLKSEQNAWRKNERDACADIECMLAAYQNRLIQLAR